MLWSAASLYAVGCAIPGHNIPGVSTTRSLGMIGALELSGPQGYLELGGQRVYQEALRRGAYLRPLGHTIYIAPALNIADADLDDLLSIVHASVRSVTAPSHH